MSDLDQGEIIRYAEGEEGEEQNIILLVWIKIKLAKIVRNMENIVFTDGKCLKDLRFKVLGSGF